MPKQKKIMKKEKKRKLLEENIREREKIFEESLEGKTDEKTEKRLKEYIRRRNQRIEELKELVNEIPWVNMQSTIEKLKTARHEELRKAKEGLEQAPVTATNVTEIKKTLEIAMQARKVQAEAVEGKLGEDILERIEKMEKRINRVAKDKSITLKGKAGEYFKELNELLYEFKDLEEELHKKKLDLEEHALALGATGYGKGTFYCTETEDIQLNKEGIEGTPQVFYIKNLPEPIVKFESAQDIITHEKIHQDFYNTIKKSGKKLPKHPNVYTITIFEAQRSKMMYPDKLLKVVDENRMIDHTLMNPHLKGLLLASKAARAGITDREFTRMCLEARNIEEIDRILDKMLKKKEKKE